MVCSGVFWECVRCRRRTHERLEPSFPDGRRALGWRAVEDCFQSQSWPLFKTPCEVWWGNAWVVGRDFGNSYTTLSLIEHWNGCGWSTVPNPNLPAPSPIVHVRRKAMVWKRCAQREKVTPGLCAEEHSQWQPRLCLQGERVCSTLSLCVHPVLLRSQHTQRACARFCRHLCRDTCQIANVAL